MGGASPGPPAPPPVPPPSPAPGPASAYDCVLRSYFVERAAQVNPNIDANRAQQIVDALAGDPSLPANCVVKPPSTLPAAHSEGVSMTAKARARVAETGRTVYADSSKGNDSTGDGSIGRPFRTIERALHAVRVSGPGNNGTRTISLRSGTYFLQESIELTAADSGLTIQTHPGDATAWISGAVPLDGVKWEKDDAGSHLQGGNIWSAALNNIRGLSPDGVRSLRIDGARAILARYPNCNPETQLCFGKSSSTAATTTTATSWVWSNAGGTPQKQYRAPENTDRLMNCTHPSVHGCDIAYTMRIGGAGCDLLTPSISHFCTTFKVVGATMAAAKAPHQPYADPSGAVFTAMHGGSWCSFNYEVGGYAWDPATQTGTFNFSSGGQQCNRMEVAHGPTVIENVWEELDSPSEFFFNRTTQRLFLWYNATAPTSPSSAESIVAAAHHTLFAVRGSQQAPVRDVVLKGLGFRDTAPTLFFPHTGPSGGDWTVNRYAAVREHSTVLALIIVQTIPSPTRNPIARTIDSPPPPLSPMCICVSVYETASIPVLHLVHGIPNGTQSRSSPVPLHNLTGRG